MAVTVRDWKKTGAPYLVIQHQGRRWVRAPSSPTWCGEKRAAENRCGCPAHVEARQVAELLDQGITPDAAPSPTFAAVAKEYLRSGMGHLSRSTRDDRQALLRAEGKLVARFGAQRLDAISRAMLLAWWGEEIEGAGKSLSTGRNALAAIAAVFHHAMDLELVSQSPVDELRAVLRRRARTARGRSGGPAPQPIEDPEDLDALLQASQAMGGWGSLLTVVLVDAGLRLGEAGGLRWERIWFGRDASDETRSLEVVETRPRGKASPTSKSGRARRVALSRRLRAALREEWMRRGQPRRGRVFPTFEPRGYRRRHFKKACARAEIGARKVKDLRDTWACHLLTAGVQLGYISDQLGHADPSVTARHYSRWIGAGSYRRPMIVRGGEVPADLLARLSVGANRSQPKANRASSEEG